MQSTPVLQANSITMSIQRTTILHKIDLSISPGNMFGLLGPNGAGKTTLLKLLTGQVISQKRLLSDKTAKFSGTINLHGKSIGEYSPQTLAQQIAVVSQTNQNVFALTCRQVVAMGLLPHMSLLARTTLQHQQQIDLALNSVGLLDKQHQAYQALSGGEQQRCLIARALVQGAPILILDEPVNHLDVYYQHQILHLLNTLCQQQGKTVILSLHDLNLAAQYCDTVALMHKGSVIANGTPQQVFIEDRLSTVFQLPCKVIQESSALEEQQPTHRAEITTTRPTHVRVEFRPNFICTSQQMENNDNTNQNDTLAQVSNNQHIGTE